MNLVALGSVALVWVIAESLNTAGVFVMAGVCGLQVWQLRKRQDKARGAVAAGWRSPTFRFMFWASLGALAVAVFAPLALFATAPPLAALGAWAIFGVAYNVLAVPFRWWLWGTRRERLG
jgi:hypothetical protein